jgi:hypothetical protein
MLSYEMCMKLKEAGFPQKESILIYQIRDQRLLARWELKQWHGWEDDEFIDCPTIKEYREVEITVEKSFSNPKVATIIFDHSQSWDNPAPIYIRTQEAKALDGAVLVWKEKKDE